LLAKAGKYLHSAEMLRREKDFDSAASRLYYAMFYCAEALLLKDGLSFSSHHGVIAGFGKHFVASGEMPAEMHQWLRLAFDARHDGDYVAESTIQEADILDLQHKAAQFLDRTKDFLELK